MMMMMMMDSGGSRGGAREGGGYSPAYYLRPHAQRPYIKVWIRHWLTFKEQYQVFKELCHETWQNSKSGNIHQIKWNKKKPLKTSKKGINNKENTKVRTDGPTWGRLKRIKIVGFWNLVRLTYFQSSLLLLETFDIMGWRHLFHTKL